MSEPPGTEPPETQRPDDAAVRSIAVVTGARADWGLYRAVLAEIGRTPAFRLRLMVCGAHLSAAFGGSLARIVADGFAVDDRIEMLTGDTSPQGIGEAIAAGINGFAAAFGRARPDLLMLLGDRYEMLAAALAALPFAIPIAHLHGGELTEGLIDDAIRHSLTKLSHLHFVSAAPHRDRVIQMGEQPERVFLCGAPGLDTLLATRPAARGELEQMLGLSLAVPPLLVTFHPVTLEYAQTDRQIGALLAALAEVDRPILFTYPNADTASDDIVAAIRAFVATRPSARLVANLGSEAYFGMMSLSAAMVGNSSSGLIEAPSLALPVVNIGDRQRGRLRARNVIDCPAETDAIKAAIRRAVDPAFRAGLAGLVNPYGDGAAAPCIVAALRRTRFGAELVKKRFYDIADPGLPVQAQ